jgi:D-alanyl-D-alanine carboxypeptidase (penicillin-binding protein 5/6)
MAKEFKGQDSGVGGHRRSLFFLVMPFLFFLCCLLSSVVHADEVRARAAIVMEESTGRILYGKNPNLRLLPASTTKLMTAMVALDRVNPNDTFVISEKAASCTPVKANFRVGEKVTVETLLNAALIKSANDAALALAEGVAGSEEEFVKMMNEKVIALGMSDTNFVNATGLPGHGQYITAYDLARMLRHALRYPLIREIISTKASRISTEDGREIFIKNSNKLLWSDDTVLGGKTGYTRAAKHCFVCASEQGDETVIAAVLGAPSRKSLWKESEVLIEKGFAIVAGKEDPVMYFTRADYKSSLQPASYRTRSTEMKTLSHKRHRWTAHKKALLKKAHKKKRYRRARVNKYVRRHKSGECTHADTRESGGDNG